MRNLKFKDLGKASKIVKKLNLRVDKDTNINDIDSVGASLFLKLVENYNMVQDDLADFMSNLLEDENISKEDFLNLDLNNVYTYLEKLKEDEGFSNFLSALSNIVKTTTK
ncbi:hypothetical protein ANHYDRO_01416 [Anaerococcus hydrogenalis DSM 7454]|uniref:Uncharacterized protein n=1 Tax=Anaerococcus hydrogenalis DSM 7454 TaxID=561177 RepID=B6W9Z0_9FIRM|nr:hypothetical protein [Anaerococcus hydrogenalis]EEB35750.1 hypothetical protein ANHYDRO_01416 [Anaerococcus hydrogenalis DSM 7454]